jgi:UDP-3-O-[3-hydroxymyristoyl] glucosamine N-acyltransferase
MPQYTAAEIAKHVQGVVVGDPTVVLTGFALADQAGPQDLTWAETPAYLTRVEAGTAAAVLIAGEASSTKTLIRVANARIAFALVLPLFFPEPTPAPGVHPDAAVDASAVVDPTAHVGPHCHVGARCRIGPRTVLAGGNHLGSDCQLGEDVRLFPNVVLYAGTRIGNRVRIHAGAVVGSDGFGYVLDKGEHRKVPQVGHVVIEDDVELGANTTVDRGALGATVIGRGTKVDNLVQIAHNVVIGKHGILVSQVGISGSTRLGDYVTVAGQAGLIGHLKIGNRVLIAGQSGVTNDIGDGERWFGSPARPATQMKRQILAMDRLPDLLRRVTQLEKELAALKTASPAPAPVPDPAPPA